MAIPGDAAYPNESCRKGSRISLRDEKLLDDLLAD
jgi:hypothetical protein